MTGALLVNFIFLVVNAVLYTWQKRRMNLWCAYVSGAAFVILALRG